VHRDVSSPESRTAKLKPWGRRSRFYLHNCRKHRNTTKSGVASATATLKPLDFLVVMGAAGVCKKEMDWLRNHVWLLAFLGEGSSHTLQAEQSGMFGSNISSCI